MNASSSIRQNSTTTQLKILDAAESLFVERGFAATSLRAIAGLAEVNLAATHYHFGSKEALFQAAIHRRVNPINEARLQALDELERSSRVLTVAAILAAFFKPLTEGGMSAPVTKLVGRIYGEPESITKPLLEGEFGVVAGRYSSALARALPGLDETELRWRFHFMIGGMIQVLSFGGPLGMKESADTRQQGIERLQSFAVAGFEQGQREVAGG
ncbi:MAG: TetR family transcriptional regulator [Gammaproteobacteria bacterium]|nr:TetR family transcriptional regulator [Gammaproteobacteria bacterium]